MRKMNISGKFSGKLLSFILAVVTMTSMSLSAIMGAISYRTSTPEGNSEQKQVYASSAPIRVDGNTATSTKIDNPLKTLVTGTPESIIIEATFATTVKGAAWKCIFGFIKDGSGGFANFTNWPQFAFNPCFPEPNPYFEAGTDPIFADNEAYVDGTPHAYKWVISKTGVQIYVDGVDQTIKANHADNVTYAAGFDWIMSADKLEFGNADGNDANWWGELDCTINSFKISVSGGDAVVSEPETTTTKEDTQPTTSVDSTQPGVTYVYKSSAPIRVDGDTATSTKIDNPLKTLVAETPGSIIIEATFATTVKAAARKCIFGFIKNGSGGFADFSNWPWIAFNPCIPEPNPFFEVYTRPILADNEAYVNGTPHAYKWVISKTGVQIYVDGVKQTTETNHANNDTYAAGFDWIMSADWLEFGNADGPDVGWFDGELDCTIDSFKISVKTDVSEPETTTTTTGATEATTTTKADTQPTSSAASSSTEATTTTKADTQPTSSSAASASTEATTTTKADTQPTSSSTEATTTKTEAMPTTSADSSQPGVTYVYKSSAPIKVDGDIATSTKIDNPLKTLVTGTPESIIIEATFATTVKGAAWKCIFGFIKDGSGGFANFTNWPQLAFNPCFPEPNPYFEAGTDPIFADKEAYVDGTPHAYKWVISKTGVQIYVDGVDQTIKTKNADNVTYAAGFDWIMSADKLEFGNADGNDANWWGELDCTINSFKIAVKTDVSEPETTTTTGSETTTTSGSETTTAAGSETTTAAESESTTAAESEATTAAESEATTAAESEATTVPEEQTTSAAEQPSQPEQPDNPSPATPSTDSDPVSVDVKSDAVAEASKKAVVQGKNAVIKDAVLTIEPAQTETVTEIEKLVKTNSKLLAAGLKKYAAVDITLKIGEKKISAIQGKVTVKFAITSIFTEVKEADKVAIYRVDIKDGAQTLSFLGNSKVDNAGDITFDTDHFSPYVFTLVEKDVDTPIIDYAKDIDTNVQFDVKIDDIVKTGDMTKTFPFIITALLTLIGFILISGKKTHEA